MPSKQDNLEQKLTGISAETKSTPQTRFLDVSEDGAKPAGAGAVSVSTTQVVPVDENTYRRSTDREVSMAGTSLRDTPGASTGGMTRSRTRKEGWRAKVAKLMDGVIIQVILFFCLFVALFTKDVVAITSAADAVDDAVDGLLLAVLIIFAGEIIINSIVRDTYLWSFFFFMDLVGTLSLLTDISWLAAGWLETGGENEDAKAGRLKNASKIARLVRLVRVVRVVKLLTYMEKMSAARKGGVEEAQKGAPTSLGTKLSESVSRQVAALVLVTVLVAPLLIYDESDQSVGAYLTVFELNAKAGLGMQDLQPLVDEYFAFINADVKAVVLRIGDATWDLRETGERKEFTKRSSDRSVVEGDGVYMENDKRDKNHQEAMLNIILVVFVIVELVGFTAILNAITSKLVVRPMERIFHVLQDSANEIMSSLNMKVEDLEDEEEEVSEDQMMNAMEETIGKMGKLVKHFQKKGGGSAVDDLVADADVDESTLAYLKQTVGETAKSKPGKSRASVPSAPSPVGGKSQVTMPVGMVVPRNGHGPGMGPGVYAGGSDLEVVAGVSLDKLNSWSFSVFEISKQDLVLCVCRMFHELGFVADGLVNPRILFNFVTEVEKGMRDNPYHNWRHVCDVTHTLYRYIPMTEARTHLTMNEKFAMMVAAICHDLGHVGVNNAFLVRKRDALALTYNDQSVLENFHAAQLYRMIESNPECDIFSCLTDEDDYRAVRKLVIDMILHTDMVHHFPMTSQVEVFCELHSDDLAVPPPDGLFSAKPDRALMFNMLLHAADISNPVKPFEIYKKWADVVLAEFFSQGDMEKGEGVPVSPMMDRDTTSRPGSQIGFIEFLVGPLYAHMLKVFPELEENCVFLVENRIKFGEESAKEFDANPDKSAAEKEEERKKLMGRLKGFVSKFPKKIQDKFSSRIN